MNEPQSPRQKYILNRFSIGLSPYEAALRRSGLDSRVCRIIDVGCGPGQWIFAAYKVVPKAEIWGIDRNQEFIGYAQEYASIHGYDKVHFEVLSYFDLPEQFTKGYFDVLMCNGVLMYLDRNRAFEIFSYLLRPGGSLFLFYNHHVGYYLHKSIQALCSFSIKELYGYGLKALGINLFRRLLLRRNDGDTVLTPNYLQRVAQRHGVRLREIPTELPLYRHSFLGLPYVFSMQGERV